MSRSDKCLASRTGERNHSVLKSSNMAELEEKVNQYKAYLARYFENPKDEKIIYVFKKLDKINVTLDILQATGVGKVINSFRKHDGEVGEKARQLVAKWKQLVSSTPTPVSSGGLQTETVSETTYSHSGRVMQRLDEVVKAPYMDGMAVVKKEQETSSKLSVKEEPQEVNGRPKSESSSNKTKHSSSHKDSSRKRDREGGVSGERESKRTKNVDGSGESGFDLARVKMEKMRRKEKDETVKKEPEDINIKQEKGSPSRLASSKDNCDSVPNDASDKRKKENKHSSNHKSSSSKHKPDKHRDSKHQSEKHKEVKRDKHKDENQHQSKKSSSSESKQTDNILKPEEQEKIKREPQDEKERKKDSSSSKVKVKVEAEERAVGGDLSGVKVKQEGDLSGVKVKQEGEKPLSKSHETHNSNKHHRSSSGSAKSDRTSSGGKVSSSASSSASKHKDKSSNSNSSSRSKDKHSSDKKHQSSSSSSKSSSSSSKKKPVKKPVVQEFNMFDMPNGLSDHGSADEEDTNVEKSSKPVKVKTEPGKTFSIGRLTAKLPAGSVPLPRVPVSLTQDDILGSLPETTPNYKPLPHFDMSSPTKKTEYDESYADVGSKKNCRTMVYSGRRNVFLSSVPTLYDACITVLKDNIDSLDFVGGVPFDILKPVLEMCSATQLYGIEDVNPQFIGETDELWQEHCKKDFRTQKLEQFESSREMYIRCHDARDAKLKSLTASISKSIQKAKEPVRTTKLAYVDSTVKAPRDVARQQRINGTAGPMGKRDPYMKLSSHKVPGQQLARQPIPIGDRHTSTSLARPRSDKQVRLPAPMMRKTLKFMKSLKR